MKVCKNCKIEKQYIDFYFRLDSEKYRESCKDCFKKERKQPNKEYKKLSKYRDWKKKYDNKYHKSDKYMKYQRIYNKSEKYKEAAFAWNLTTYWPGLSSQEAKEKYFEILESQKGKCAICNNLETRKCNGKIRNLCVDHCHKTGHVRGLLCSRCNITIGRFEDNADLLKSASFYLEKGIKK